MSETRGRSPVVTGWLVAVVGLILAGGLGYLLMWIGSNRIEAAKKTERPYQIALGYVAQSGVEAAQKAEQAVGTNNYGQAQQALDDAGKAVTAMERAASDANRDRLQQVRAALSDAQAAVGKQDKEAAGKIAALRQQLEAFAAEGQ